LLIFREEQNQSLISGSYNI